jgi:hypothetical protein
MKRRRTSCSWAGNDVAELPAGGLACPSVARARWRALLTAGTEVSSNSATSAALQPSTSRRTSTARCRAVSCCKATTKASATDSRCSATAAGSGPSWGQVVQEPVRAGLQPRHLGTLRSGRDAATPAGLEHPQAGGRGDPVQPGAQRSASLEGVQVLPGPQQGLLGGVLGVVEGAQHPVAVHVQLTDMRRHQQPEPRLVTGQRRPEQPVGARFGRC